MSLEQNVLVKLAELRADLAIYQSEKSVRTSQERMNAVVQSDAFNELYGYGPALIPVLASCHSAVPNWSLAPLIRAAVGPVFEVPNQIYPNEERTRAYCESWLAMNANKYGR